MAEEHEIVCEASMGDGSSFASPVVLEEGRGCFPL